MASSNDFGAAARELRESRLVVLLRSATDAIVLSARHSRIVAGAGRVARDWRSLSAVARLRVIALTIAVAAAAHVVLEMLVPRHLAPTVPPLLWVAVGIISAAVAAAARPPSCH